jgi:hypothetical protein
MSVNQSLQVKVMELEQFQKIAANSIPSELDMNVPDLHQFPAVASNRPRAGSLRGLMGINPQESYGSGLDPVSIAVCLHYQSKLV